ncbi:FkbM family methyltransferase [Fontivita pretiosa]|uniref:FkbM family methyltransferase n=1 Tax=Fontivita pretiosa TaxID=2989684 RepID=UPI003D16AACA
MGPRRIQIRDVAFQVAAATGSWVWNQAAQGKWQPQTYAVIDRFVTPDTTFLDIGAWVGPIALYAAHKARRVYAFEPDPVAFAALSQNLALNPQLHNLHIYPCAIGLHDGQARLGVRIRPGDSTSSLLCGGGEGWTVACRRLETFCAEQNVDDPLFLKIDVEGFEYELIPRLFRWLRGRQFVMHLSTHPHLIEQSIDSESRLGRMRGVLRRRLAQRRLSRAMRRLPLLVYATDTTMLVMPVPPRRRLAGEWFGAELTRDRDIIVLSRPAAAA